MHDPRIAFDTHSYPLIADSGASSMVTPFESNFIEGTHKKLTGGTILVIALGITALGIGSMLCQIKDNKKISIDLQT